MPDLSISPRKAWERYVLERFFQYAVLGSLLFLLGGMCLEMLVVQHAFVLALGALWGGVTGVYVLRAAWEYGMIWWRRDMYWAMLEVMMALNAPLGNTAAAEETEGEGR